MKTLIRIEQNASLRPLAELLGSPARVAQDSGGDWWIGLESVDAKLAAQIDKIPGQRYAEEGNGWLVRPGESVASARLEQGLDWKRLDDVLSIELPAARIAGRLTTIEKREVRLMRGGEPTQPAGAIIALETLAEWVDRSSELRLRRLRWAVRGRHALVLGEPLPPVDASYLVAIDRVLIPAGTCWTPNLSPDQLRRVFSVGQGQWLVWWNDSDWSVLDDDVFAALRRAAVRSLNKAAGGHQE